MRLYACYLPLALSVLFLSGCLDRTPHSHSTVAGPPKAAWYPTQRGEEIYKQRCIACHGLDGRYRGSNAADLSLSRIDSVSIANTIVNGRNGMPMFSGAISDSDLASLVNYVQTLRQY